MRHPVNVRKSETNPLVFLDVAIADIQTGRMVFELFQDEAPKAAENFRQLCTGEAGVCKSSGILLHYKGTRFHKIKRGYLMSGGDLITQTGQNGTSIYDNGFPDENREQEHDARGLLSTVSRRSNTNDSQFAISFVATKARKGKSIVFGHLIAGFGVLRDIEIIQPTCITDKPALECVIWDCGQLESTIDLEKLIPYPENCPYPTFLQDYEVPLDMTELEANLRVASELKVLANDLYKDEQWFQSSERYRQALRYLDSDFYAADVDRSDEKFPQLEELANTLRIDRAAALIKCGRALEAKMSCDLVLRYTSSGKALLRRGQAYLLLGKTQETLEDLIEAAKLMPNNQDVKEEISRCKAMQLEEKEKLKKALSRCFP